ncbi:hypothetical protein KY331_06210 [Candidatus Woesearchaeota archaeon]|nr:hypothetical protein [Candidatus Woesearchaeota archaeon]
MELFQTAMERAKKNIQIADHMLSVTYPLVKDTKLLLAIIENIFLTYTNAMSAILNQDRILKKIPPFKSTFESKFNIFKQRCVDRYKIDRSYVIEMQNLKEIIVEHKKSPVEFVRKDRFVICSSTYKLKTINLETIKSYLNKAKLFIGEVTNLLSKNEGLFRDY